MKKSIFFQNQNHSKTMEVDCGLWSGSKPDAQGNPDNISRERTTEIIDASETEDPDILEDNWRLTSQANKPMINLWKTIFTFADNSLKDKEAGSGSALLMAMFPNYGKARFEIAFVCPSVDGSYNERKARGDIVPRNRWIDNLNSRSAYDAPRPNGKEFFYVRCNSGHTRQVDLQSFGRPLYSEQKSEPRQEEPDYDLPTESIPPSPHPSRSDAPHEDEGTAQAKSRMRRPAPQSVEEERKIKAFAKKPITFVFRATYGENLINIMEHGLKSGRSQSNPSGRVPVHMACIDGREVYNMAMKDRPIVKMMMQNSAHILCLNEADAFLSAQDEKSRELIKTFIRFGYKGIVIKQWSSRPIACFVRGGPSQRVRVGEPHSGCSDVSSEPRKIALILNTTFRPRTAWQLRDHPCLLNPRSTLDRDCHHAPLSNDTDVTKRLSFSTSSRVTSIVVCSQNHPTNHSSSLTAAT